VLLACGSRPAPAPGAAVDRALIAALTAADHLRAPWRCASLDTPALPVDHLSGWTVAEHRLARDSAADEIVIGVVADAAGSAAPTIATLARLRGKLDEAKPELVLALGGMGATRAELEATLGTLAAHASFPVVALAGDLEPAAAHAAAIAALRARGDAIFDARLVRWIELPGLTVATVPGAGAAARLAAGDDGCGWSAQELDKLYAELSARKGVRVVASAEAPRDGEPSGELALAASAAQPIDIHLHGPTRPTPTPARTGSRDGHAIALSPGTSDPTTRLPDAHAATAGPLTVRGGAWTWRPIVDEPTARR